MYRMLAAALLASVAAACGSDNGTNPNDDNDASPPGLDAETRAAFCIRSDVTVGADSTSVAGSISSADCHEAIADDGYFEGFYVTVDDQRQILFEVESGFDSWLELFQVNDLGDPEGTAILLAEDDDSGPGLDAAFTRTLFPGRHYFVFVSGYNDAAQGSYRLLMF